MKRADTAARLMHIQMNNLLRFLPFVEPVRQEVEVGRTVVQILGVESLLVVVLAQDLFGAVMQIVDPGVAVGVGDAVEGIAHDEGVVVLLAEHIR